MLKSNSIIVSKRHPVKFYGVLLLTAFLCFIPGSIISLAIIISEKHEMLIGFVPFIGIFSAMIYVYFRNSPKVIIDKSTLKIGNDLYELQDIKHVKLTGRVPFRFLLDFPMEGMLVLFHNGTEKILIDDMYSNTGAIKSFIEQVVIMKQDYKTIEVNTLDLDDIALDNAIAFKGNQFTSLQGAFLFGTIIFIVLLLATAEDPSFEIVLIFTLLGGLYFLFRSWFMNYFIISDKYLVIKNHNLLWQNTVYRLADIKEVVLEQKGRHSNSLRITLNDYKYKSYRAVTLRKITWINLRDDLERKNIPLRNEGVL